MEELNSMLADLAQDGAADSSGTFTISLDMALEKLSSYRLANPGLFVLNLVAAAVTSGASYFKVDTVDDVTTLSYDFKESMQKKDIDGLFSSILDSKAPAHLRELGLAVHGACSLDEHPSISLKVFTREYSQEITIDKEGTNTTEGPAGRYCTVELSLTYAKPGTWSRLISSKSGNTLDFMKNIYHFCRFAPLRLLINGLDKGEPVTGNFYDKPTFAWRYLQGSQPLKVIVPYERSADLLLSSKRSSPTASSMVLSLANKQNLGLLIISRGIAFSRANIDIGFPMAQAVITADHLEKNLSQSDLVENEDYQALIETVREQVKDLVVEVCSKPPVGLSSVDSETFRKTLLAEYQDEKKRPTAISMFLILQDMQVECHTRKGKDKLINFWRELAESGSPASEDYRQRLSKALKSRVVQALEVREWENALIDLKYYNEIALKPAEPIYTMLSAVSSIQKNIGVTRQRDAYSVEMSPELVAKYNQIAFMLGKIDKLEDNAKANKFLSWIRALEQGSSMITEELAEELEYSAKTALLFLWLGFYHRHCNRPSKAAELWNTAIKKAPASNWDAWNQTLLPELRGKISFIELVRWQASRGIDEIQLRLTGQYKDRPGDEETARVLKWSQHFWHAMERGNTNVAYGIFLEEYLPSLINNSKLELYNGPSSHLIYKGLSFF